MVNIKQALNSAFKRYLQSLERRIQSIEEMTPQDHAQQRHSPTTPSHASSNAGSTPANSSIPEVTQLSISTIQSDAPPEIHQSTNPARSDFVATDPDIFVGGSSGVSFTQLILNAMNGGNSSKVQTEPFSIPRHADAGMGNEDLFSLPADSADLIQCFFKWHFALTPIFHEPSARETFNAVLQSDISVRHQHRYTLALMNMIFAFTISHRQTSVSAARRYARRHYEIAIALIQSRLLLDWDIEKVQILLLGSRYLQTSNSPDECWNVLGLAIRIAYGLELHRNPGDEFDYITKEVRKRVWCNLFIFDKLLSMIYGRPSATLATDSTLLPEDLDDSCIEKHRLLYPSPRRPSSMSFCIQVAKLYRLLETASRLGDSGNVKRGNLAFTMASLDEEYEEWYQNVPSHLKVQSSIDDPNEQALILALRANMVRILIHRQSLAFPLHTLSGNSNQEQKSAASGGMKGNMFQFSRNICVSSAMEIIKLVGMRYQKRADAVGPSWFNLYYRKFHSLCS